MQCLVLLFLSFLHIVTIGGYNMIRGQLGLSPKSLDPLHRTNFSGLKMQVKLLLYIKLLSIHHHLCNAAPAEYDQIWDNLIR